MVGCQNEGMSDAAERTQRFIHSMLVALGGDPSLLGRTGTTAVPDVERADSRRVACYQIGKHTALPCDPGVVDRLSALASGTESMSDDAFRSWAADQGASVLGQSVMKLAGAQGLASIPPPGPVHVFDWSRPGDLELMQAFVDACSDDDLDEAEVAMDDLDDMAIAVLLADGSVGAFASSRPFEDDRDFGDIGIVAKAETRRSGWGRAAVSVLINQILVPAGVEPLYRCDPDNVGSDRLSAALGFEAVVALTVVELPSL